MMRELFDLMTLPLSLFEDPIYNYFAMALIGLIAFLIAFRTVGELGLRGEAGSIAHWIIRIIVFVLIWALCSVLINIIHFIRENYIVVIISILLLLVLLILKYYSKKNKDCLLNKTLFNVSKGV